jgi:hypothetical protein
MDSFSFKENGIKSRFEQIYICFCRYSRMIILKKAIPDYDDVPDRIILEDMMQELRESNTNFFLKHKELIDLKASTPTEASQFEKYILKIKEVEKEIKELSTIPEEVTFTLEEFLHLLDFFTQDISKIV